MVRSKHRISLFLIFILCVPGLSQSAAGIQKGFENPPPDARVMMRWWWFGPSVTKGEIERELRVMKEGGIGGVEVQPVYPLLPDDPKTGHRNLPYLSDEFLDMLKFASQKSKELGMRFDLTLGSGWSFGGAKTPITEAAGQLRTERVKVAPNSNRAPLPAMIAAEKLLAVFSRVVPPANLGPTAAFPGDPLKEVKEIRDGAAWFPPSPHDREVIFFIAGKSGMQVKRPSVGSEGYVLNHLDKPSVDNYLRLTGDRLFEKFATNERPYSVFCDSLEVYNQDWTDDFDEEFQRRRGYDIKQYLPALIADGGPTESTNGVPIVRPEVIPDIRYDWGRTITELFNERFMMPMQAWAKANNTRFRIQGYGVPPASISSNKWADISDGEGAQWKVVRAARWASSANHIYGRNITSSETWTWLNSPVFRATPLDMKAEADIHFLQGINQLIGHGWGYTPPYVEYPGWRFYAAGAYSEQNPWWIVMPDLARYLQRISWLLRQGSPHNDVALYLPTADAYSHFTAGKVHLIDADRDLVGEAIMPSIFEAGYNLDLFDDEVVRSEAKSEKGILSLGSSKHQVVVLPGIEKMPLETLRKLNEFVRAGGKIVVSRRAPGKIPGMRVTDAERAEFESIGKALFRDGNSVRIVKTDEEVGGAIKQVLQPDVEILPSAKAFGSVHRKLADGDLFFIANTSNQKRQVTVKLRASAPNVELMDAITGKLSIPDIVSKDERSTTVALEFEPYGSCVVLFGNGKPSGGKSDAKPASAAATIDLSSDWQVTFGSSTPVRFPNLRSWTDSEPTKYFSGSAVYERSFDLAASSSNVQTKLDFGDGAPLEPKPQRNGMRTWYEPPIREAAVVYVNGQRAGALWCPPYAVDISKLLKPGANSLRIVVGNTALNHMSGRKLPDHKLLNLRYGERFQPQDMEKIEPLPSGIMGTIRLISYDWKK